METRMDKRTKQTIIGAVLVLSVILVIGAVALIRHLTPGKEWMNLSEYYQVPEGEVMIVLNGKIYEKNALLMEENIYLEMEMAQTCFNHRFYWDSNENLLIYATPTEIIRAEVGSRDYQVDKTKKSLSHSVVKTIGNQAYVSLEFVALYSDMQYEAISLKEDGKSYVQRVVINNEYETELYVDVKKTTQVRTEADRKSLILAELTEGEQLQIMNGGTQENGYLKVMTEDGIFGYVKKSHVTEGYYDMRESTYVAPVYTSIAKDYTINLTWHMVTNETANANLTEMLNNTKGITTISPTWFSISSNEGTLSSLASETYVTQAHNLGLEVWGLVDNFNEEVDTYQVLSRTSTREKLINEILAQAIMYNLDGINIDFENLTLETGVHFIQFLRELSVKCRNNKIILSVDNYVPASYNKYYDYAEQGVLVDYVVIMAYDEHYAGSPEAGSVSSIGYVENAIANTLKMVPKEKVIMGIPFYTRLWKESVTDGVATLSSEALGMESAELTLEANGAEPVWDVKTAQYYAEYQKESTTYKIWMEEETSIETKVAKIHAASLAGVASWRLGFEKNTIWDVILKYVN